ncbi:MAG: LysR family transcriptional regulator [Methylobacterium sp.]|uniref:LysR family transcriptional regulator n=1 Tax=Methylobacterium sp. TaxID=409 RepID=UPI0025EFAB33|nr:LysR family transcriptional regulator [Methylobacterium sp.]MBX9930186.1 LysR family transcriptional regulator [Methylobacterium sp.]
MDLEWLRDFLALAEHKVFSRAAEARNVTQPAFSRRIRALEDWIGTALFVRSAQGAALTPAGAHFHPLAEDLSQRLAAARATTKNTGRRKEPALSIAATHALSFTFFPTWAREHVRFERLGTLNLISDSMDACEEIMLSGEVDYLLCHHHPFAPNRLHGDRFCSIQVGLDTLVPVSARDSDGRPLWSVLPSGKGPTRLLAYSVASGLGRILNAVRPVAAIGSVETVFTSHLAATLATMAGEGHGLAWLPLTTAQEALDTGRLVRAGSEELDVPVEIRLFCSATASMGEDGLPLI